jgi:type IV pilus assembly protein PilN
MIRINLLPVRVSRKKTAGRQQLVLFALVILGGYVGNLLWVGSRAGDLAVRQAKVARTAEEIAQLDRIIGEVKDIKEQQAQLREKLEILAQLKANRSGPVRVLDALATVTPRRLWLSRMEERSQVVTFEGSAVTIDDVSEFMTALKGSQYFGNVELARTAAKTDKPVKYVDFTVTAAVIYAPQPAPVAATAR